jgi:hypothetical protein
MYSIFGKCAPSVVAFIQAAKTDLTIAVCWFTHPGIFKALKEAVQRGVSVRLAVNHDQLNFNLEGLDFYGLERIGATVLAYGGDALLHSKFAVADGQRVLMGSFNWTRSDNLDCLVVLDDKQVADQFLAAFADWAVQCASVSKIRDIPPRPANFQPLFQPRAWTIPDLRSRIAISVKTWILVVKDLQVWADSFEESQYELQLNKPVNLSFEQIGRDRQEWDQHLRQVPLIESLRTLVIRFGILIKQGDIVIAALPKGNILGIGIVVSEMANKEGRLGRMVQWVQVDSLDLSIALDAETSTTILSYKESGMALISQIEAGLATKKAALDTSKSGLVSKI